MGTLLKLPIELTFQIFGDLDDAALLALAKCCRHLNIIATSYYLSCHHTPDPSVEIDLGTEPDLGPLPFLRISTQLTSSQHLHIRFTRLNYLDEIHGLERLVDKLSSVKTVILSLASISTFSTQADEARFTKAIRDLLTTIIARSCQTLRISCGPSLNHSHPTSERRAQRVSLSKLSRVFTTPYRRIMRKSSATTSISDTLSPETFPASKLTEFGILSDTLFDRSFLGWTIHVINTSPITFLGFGNPSRRLYKWDELLSAVHSPTLLWCFIADILEQLPYSSVAAFLARHQTLTSLLCQGLSRDGPNYPKFFLPRLTVLVSNPQSIVHLLEDVTAFPSLRDVFLRVFPNADHLPFDPSIMNNALECVSHCPNELGLSLEFGQQDEAFITWLDDVSDNFRIERLLYCVIRMELLIDNVSTKTLSVLPKWLALLPALCALTIQHIDTVPPNFVRSVIQACPQLKTLKINEETNTATTWLDMKD